jgi:hypothetical protein
MCPAILLPSSHKAAEYKIDFGGPKVPNWRTSFLWIPFLGKYLNAFYVGRAYMTTSHERVANFMAVDFTLGLDSVLIGQKVAPNRARGGKAFWF